MYHLAPPRQADVAVVGCGGTGGWVAESLCRLLANSGRQLILIDGDRVEERNLTRQNFQTADLGRFKAQALAERLALKYRVAVGYNVSPLLKEEEGHRGLLSDCGIVVGCVDNAMARAAIASHIRDQWWVDAGNGPDFGQVLIGNNRRGVGGCQFVPEKELVLELPPPTHVCPELVGPGPGGRPGDLGPPGATWLPCAQAVEVGQQGPTINTWMAALVVETVVRLLEGRLTWWQAYLNLEDMSVRTVVPTPEGLARYLGGPTAKVKMNL